LRTLYVRSAIRVAIVLAAINFNDKPRFK